MGEDGGVSWLFFGSILWQVIGDGDRVARCRRLWQGEVRVVRLGGVLKDSWLVRVLVLGIGHEL